MRITDDQLELLRKAYEAGDHAEPNRLTVRLLIAEVVETRRLLREFEAVLPVQLGMGLREEE